MLMNRGMRGLARYRSRVWLIAVVIMTAIVATLGVRSYLWPADRAESGNLGRFAKIVGAHRLARARLTGGFPYAKCQSDSAPDRLVRGLLCDGPPPASWSSTEKLRRFVGDLRGGEDGSSPLDVHITGIWNLVWGRTDDAIENLREAVRREPSSARALNDLAVALTGFAQHHDDPSALIDAFVAADSAVRMDSTLKEARFTHALLLERLYLRTDAVESWNRYLQLDDRSRWAAEAREHVTVLRSQAADTLKRDPERFRRAVAARDSQTVRSIVAEDPSEYARADSGGARRMGRGGRRSRVRQRSRAPRFRTRDRRSVERGDGGRAHERRCCDHRSGAGRERHCTSASPLRRTRLLCEGDQTVQRRQFADGER